MMNEVQRVLMHRMNEREGPTEWACIECLRLYRKWAPELVTGRWQALVVTGPELCFYCVWESSHAKPHRRLPWVLLVLIDGRQNWCLFASYAEAEARLLGLPAVTDATIYLAEPKEWRL